MEKHKDEACDYYEIHEDSMEIINKTMPEETELEDLADLFKIFGDSTRIRILFVLFETEVCVCDLAKALNMTQSAISHQLRILKQNKLESPFSILWQMIMCGRLSIREESI